MSDDYVPQEAWNMATATMKRFDRQLTLCSWYAQQNDLINWFNILMDLRRNLVPFLDQEDFAKVETKLNSLPERWNFKNSANKNSPQVNKILDEVYIILYTCMKVKGLLLPKAADPRRAVIEM